MPSGRWLTQAFISHSSGSWKAEIKAPKDLVSGQGHFPVHRWLSSLCVQSMAPPSLTTPGANPRKLVPGSPTAGFQLGLANGRDPPGHPGSRASRHANGTAASAVFPTLCIWRSLPRPSFLPLGVTLACRGHSLLCLTILY